MKGEGKGRKDSVGSVSESGMDCISRVVECGMVWYVGSIKHQDLRTIHLIDVANLRL